MTLSVLRRGTEWVSRQDANARSETQLPSLSDILAFVGWVNLYTYKERELVDLVTRRDQFLRTGTSDSKSVLTKVDQLAK